jgi:NitT/TauT family transport system substrate-binding protein
VADFLTEYQVSTSYVNANIPEAAQLIEKFGIFKAAIAQKALPYCNITYLDGSEMQAVVTGYLSVLLGQNPQAIGGALPDADFYYAR